jgi:hypothetical protein
LEIFHIMTAESRVSLAKLLQLATGLTAMLALLLAYLAPLHFPPWTTFYGEWLFAMFVGLGLAWVISHGRLILADPRPWLAILLLVSLHAWTWGDMTPMRATLWGVFLAFGVMGWLAYSLGLSLRNTAWLNAVLMAIWLAAMISSVIAILQWSGVVSAAAWGPEFVLFSVGGGRAASNIGQPNNLGTLLVLGMGVVGYAWYADERRSLAWRGLAILSLSVLVLGTYLCDSRTALLNLILWPVFLFGWARWRRSPWPWLALAPVAMLGALHLIMPGMLDWLGSAQEPVVRAVGSRPRVWQMVLTAIGEHPWLGHGFGAVANAHLRLAPEFGAFDWTIAHHAHNVILDMWANFGLLLGTLIVLAGTWLWVRAWLEGRTIAEQFLWAMATAILVHGMLELPLHHGFFFWPWCLLLGVLGGREWKAWSPRFALPVSVAWLILFLSAALPVRTAYAQLESLFTMLRESPAAAHAALQSAPPTLGKRMFPELYERLYWLSTPFEEIRALSDKEVAALDTEASWNPLPYLGWGTAYAYAARGNAEKAAWWAERMCRMFAPEQCEEAAGKWHRRHETQPSWPDLPFEQWLPVEAKKGIEQSVSGSQTQ